jgi:hypothetical protein
MSDLIIKTGDMVDCGLTLYKMASSTKRPVASPTNSHGHRDDCVMKIDVRIEASPSERRRLLGRANVTPVIEVMSILSDGAAMAVVNARLAALEAEGIVGDQQDGR